MSEIEITCTIDLEDISEKVEDYFCNGNCLKENEMQRSAKLTDIENYVKELEKNIYFYSRCETKTMKEIYEDLERILRG